ncbi:hypothetical protein DJ568_08045 [Mucilaginibacter hurinus]|uniref:TolC family protein n=1 Tax=Mucilaginibacter hurinus TaxID=2201324 RepID=A0A367GNR3_9SPHI|nr:TolC family protein [Mucilaginibacter hurinus]RCH55132.1 hypothetical protein DJ568_08045 [Mucilaginibacter hurinus]
MKIKILTVLVILGLVIGNERVLAQESIINEVSDVYVDKLVNAAKANYPRYKIFKHRIDIAKANVSIASLSVFDALTVSYIYQPNQNTIIDPVNPTTSYFKGFQAGVFLNLGQLLRVPVNIRRAKSDQRIAESEQAEYDLTIGAEVRRRYYTYLQRVAQLKLQSRTIIQSENALKDAEHKYRRGEVTFDSYNQTQIQYTEHIQTKIEAEGNVFIAKAALEEMLGDKLENIK